MSAECVIEIRQNGPQLELVVTAPSLGGNGKMVQRALPTLDAAELDQMRLGAPPPALVNQVADKVSRWLQEPNLDLEQVLGLLNPGAAGAQRLVFNLRDVRDETLRYSLADVPVELLEPVGGGTAYALHQGVSSIVHWLPKMAVARTTWPEWPLRVLIVRSNPAQLDGNVPAGAPIRDLIVAQGNLRGAGSVQVDLLSSEVAPNLVGPPTLDQLDLQLVAGYHILIYLGHGDVREGAPGMLPVGVLQLENADGQRSEPVDAAKLSVMLQGRSVPVVLLVGCLTASDIPVADLPDVMQELPQWMRGSHGVAQSLVNGGSSVQFAVGMRFRIETSDAHCFLSAFFAKLLGQGNPGATTGDLEAAVREARRKLRLHGSPASWAAPVVFRTRGEEPMFPFLNGGRPPIAVDQGQQLVREKSWESLALINWGSHSTPGGPGVYERVRALLEVVDGLMITAVTAQGALLIPGLVELGSHQLAPAPALVNIPIGLHGPLDVGSLEGVLVERSGVGRIVALVPDAALGASGFDLSDVLSAEPQANRRRFRIQRSAGGHGPLPEGVLFNVTMEIGPASGAVYTIALGEIRTDLPRAICPGTNAVIVSPP